MFWDIVFIGFGGSLGALSRFGISRIIESTFGLSASWSVVVANLLGCFLFGLLFELTLKSGIFNMDYRPFLLTGFLGSLTTFSTFTHNNLQMMKAGDWMLAGINIVLQVFAGLLLVWAGSRVVEGA